MNLSIKVLNKKSEILEGVPSCWGEIKIKEITGEIHQEKFIMPVNYWSLEDYEKQWQEGLERIKKENISCLVTEVQNPELGMYMMIWALFKDENNKIHIQVQLLIKEILKDRIKNKELPKDLLTKEFNTQTCYEFISPRITTDDVSEWVIDL